MPGPTTLHLTPPPPDVLAMVVVAVVAVAMVATTRDRRSDAPIPPAARGHAPETLNRSVLLRLTVGRPLVGRDARRFGTMRV